MRYLDLHTHLLFGVDDGVKTQEAFLQMLETYKAAGIDTIVFTPHRSNPWVNTKEEAIEATYETARKIAAGYGITTALGCEYYYDGQSVFNPRPIEDRYVLVEFPTTRRPQHLSNLMENIVNEGYEPIIAHVERYKWLSPKSDEFKLFQNYGSWIQINVEGIEDRTAKPYLKKDVVDLISSDNHGDPLKAAKLKKHLEENPDILEKMQNLEIGTTGDNQ